MSQPIICTIIAKNYLAHARVLADTFRRYHPNGQVFVLLVDEPAGYIDPANEPFTLIPVRDLDIPNFQVMTFRYTILELNTAVKPFFLEHLFIKYGCRRLCYFDPDITINHPLDEIFSLLETNLMVLVPHLLGFLEDGQLPDEPYIMRSGVYNLGFIGVADHPELFHFLHWWQRRLEKLCVVDTARGLFTDQRWMDLAPGLFSDVYIHRDPGCDVAYWNLNQRLVEKTGQGYSVNGSPLKFFHFSGFSVENIEPISIHQNRYTLSDLPHLRPIYEEYRDLLVEHSYFTVKDWPYAYNEFCFDNGLKTPEVLRLIWRKVEEDMPDRWPDPLATQGQDTFLGWLNQPVSQRILGQPLLTNLALSLYNLRVDLQKAFPDVLGSQQLAYAEWFINSAGRDHQLDYDSFIKPVAENMAKMWQTEVAFLRGELEAREAELRTVHHQLAAIHGSRAWKITHRFQKVYQRIRRNALVQAILPLPPAPTPLAFRPEQSSNQDSQLDILTQSWEAFAQTDPMWAILSDPAKQGNKWDRDEFFATGVRTIQNMMEYLDKLPVKCGRQRALDFGCGMGRLTQALAAHFDRVDGVDISTTMIEQARVHNYKGERVQYHVNQTSQLPFPDNTFDFVCSVIVLQHVEIQVARQYVAEFIRVIRPGGLALFQAVSSSLVSGLPKYQSEVETALGTYTIDMNCFPKEEVLKTVQEAGGESVDIQPDQWAGNAFESFTYCITKP